MTTAQATDRIRVEQIRSIYRNSIQGMVTTLVTVCVLTAALVHIEAVVFAKAAVFISVMCLQTFARLFLCRAYARRAGGAHDWRPWALWFTVGAFIGGLTIGVGSIWMPSPERNDLQLIALLLIFAVAAGAVGAFAAFLPAFYVFFFAITIAPVTWLFAHGDVWHVTVGSLVVLWFMAIAEQARRAGAQFTESLRLRFENLNLIEDLRSERTLAVEANAAKSRFLAAASHDLRQPVHALALFVAALRAHETDAKALGLLDHIDGTVRSMGGLFNGLLDISRLDAGVMEVNRVSFAIQPLIERVCRDYESEANAKGVMLRVGASKALVYTDPILCERIIRNIVANAVAYTDRGKVLVGCRRGQQVRVQVWDTGRGIPASEQERIFDEFYQIGNPERDRTRGVGLGLAIVKRLAALLGQRLTLHSEPGRGTCFTLEIPSAAALTQADPGTVPVAVTSIVPGSSLILVIDDEIAIQLATQNLLQSWGYEAITAGSCAEMLDRIAARRELPALIICDYRLRDNETGSAVIERLRSEYNEEIPGMLITGDTAPDRLREAQASGYLLLHKPVPNGQLRAAIAQLTRRPSQAALNFTST